MDEQRWLLYALHVQKNISYANANGNSYLQFEGLHRVPILVVEKGSKFGPFIV